MKVGFCTLGCKVNQYETNLMIEQFKNNGYEIVDFNDFADVYVINTCTVTNMSDRKSRQMIKKAKKQNKNSILIAIGCLAQVSKNELEKIDEIDLILGNEEKKNIIKYINEYIKQNEKVEQVLDIMKQETYCEEQLENFYDKTRAIIKIEDGCNNYCSYCIIPYARGKIRSKNINDVIQEVNNVVKNGYKEIVLTGIHIASYGKDLNNISLIDLLEKLNQIDKLERIRLGSLEPTIITKDFLDRLIKLEKICPHFHLSLQSGCDETLKAMNRKYTTGQFKKIVDLLRKYYEDANITTDIIVGFPGETNQQFYQTVTFLSEIKLTKLHVFKYSVRKGTVAAKMDNQISPNAKNERSKVLIELSDKTEKEFLEKYINKQVKILLEEKEGEYIKGFTTNYLHTKIKSDKHENDIVSGIVKEVKNNMLIVE